MAIMAVDEVFEFNPVSQGQRNKAVIIRQYEGVSLWYHVKMVFGTDEHSITTLNYDQLIRWVSLKYGATEWETKRQNYFIDEFKPQNPVWEIAIACTEALYPVRFQCDSSGFFKKITNGSSMRRQFVKRKEFLRQNYGGEIGYKYIEDTELALKNDEAVNDLITKDIWMSLFFARIYGEYAEAGGTRKMKMAIPLSGFSESIPFNITAYPDTQKTELNTISVTCMGTLDTIFVALQNEEGLRPLSGKLKVVYTLGAATHRIESVHCDMEVETANQKFTFNATVYEMASPDNNIPPKEPAEHPNMEEQEISTKLPSPKRNLWDLIFDFIYRT